MIVVLAQSADLKDGIPQNPDDRRQQQAEARKAKFPDNAKKKYSDKTDKKRFQQNTLDRADRRSWIESSHTMRPAIIASHQQPL